MYFAKKTYVEKFIMMSIEGRLVKLIFKHLNISISNI